MAGFDNEVMYAVGERLQPSNAQAIGIMQGVPGSTNVSIINYTGNPQNNVSANPSSLSHDPVSGNLYLKVSGTGTTVWQQLIPAVSGSIVTLQGTTGGKVSPDITGNIFILANSPSAGVLPISTVGTLNTITINVQKSQAIAASDATKVGLSVFNSAQFTVDANGFVSTSGTGIPNTLTGNTGGAISPVAGNINTLGTGSITIAGAGNTLTTQLTGLTNHNVLIGAGTATITNVAPSATSGVPLISQGAAADPAFGTAVVAGGGTGDTSFTAYSVITGGTTSTGALQNVSGVGISTQVLTSNGAGVLPSWQNSPGSGSITGIIVDADTAPGTNPVLPTGGNITITGNQVATGIIGADVIRTNSLAANTFTIEVQQTAAVAAKDTTKNGVSHFKSSDFTVDQGFVALANPVIPTPTPNTLVSYVDDFLGTQALPSGPANVHFWYNQNMALFSSPSYAEAAHPGIASNQGNGDGAFLSMAQNVPSSGILPTSQIIIGAGAIAVNWVVKIGVGVSYTLFAGLGVASGSVGSTATTDGIYLRYRASVNAGNWQLESISSLGGTTTVNTAVPVTSGWHNCGVTVNAAGTLATYFVDGVSLGTISTNLPSVQIGGYVQALGFGVGGSLLVDLFYMTINLTTPR